MDPSLEQESLPNHSTPDNSETASQPNHTPDKNTIAESEIERTEATADSPEPVTPDSPEPVTPDSPEPVTPDSPEHVTPDSPEPVTPDSPEPVTPDSPTSCSKSTPDLQSTLKADSLRFCANTDTATGDVLAHFSDDLKVELRDRDRAKITESLLSKNSDPLPQSSEEHKALITGKQTQVISPCDNVFYSELRSKKLPNSAPHSPSVVWPSKRKTERKSLFGPPSLPQISPGRCSVFYAPLDDKFDLTSEPATPYQSAKSPPSKRRGHNSILSSSSQNPILFELSCNESDCSQNLTIVERIEREYKIKEGTVKLFNAANNIQHSMEAAKSFFTSNAKIIALLRQLQSCKVEEHEQLDEERSDPSMLSVDLTPESSRATVSLSHIRIPLEWREFDGIKKPIETGWVFCLFKLDGEVADTQTLLQIDKNTNDISFPDVIIFPVPVSHTFRLEIEVYFSQGLFSGKDGGSGISKGFRGLKSKWSTDSISSAPSSSYDSPSNMPRYYLAGFSSLSLADLSEGLYTYKLNKGAVGSSPSASTHTYSNQLLPLWGQVCCQIYVVPTGVKGFRLEGFIDLHTMVNDSPMWKHYWCVLKQTILFFWNSPDDVRGSSHNYSLQLAGHMEVKRPGAEDGSIRKNTLFVLDSDTMQHAISFASKEERDVWSKEISRCILDLQVWRNYATKCQVVPDLLTSKKSFHNRTKRVASPIESLRQSITAPPESMREGHPKRYLSTGHTAATKSFSKPQD